MCDDPSLRLCTCGGEDLDPEHAGWVLYREPQIRCVGTVVMQLPSPAIDELHDRLLTGLNDGDLFDTELQVADGDVLLVRVAADVELHFDRSGDAWVKGPYVPIGHEWVDAGAVRGVDHACVQRPSALPSVDLAPDRFF